MAAWETPDSISLGIMARLIQRYPSGVLLPSGHTGRADAGQHDVPVVGQHDVGVQALVQAIFEIVGPLPPWWQLRASEGVVYVPSEPDAEPGQLAVIVGVEGVAEMSHVYVMRLYAFLSEDSHLLFAYP